MDEFYDSISAAASERGHSSNGWDTPLPQLPPLEEKCYLGTFGGDEAHDPLYFKTDPYTTFHYTDEDLFTKFENEVMKDLHAYTYSERDTIDAYPVDESLKGLGLDFGARANVGNERVQRKHDEWMSPYAAMGTLCPVFVPQDAIDALAGELRLSQEFCIVAAMNTQIDLKQLCEYVSWSLEHPEEEW